MDFRKLSRGGNCGLVLLALKSLACDTIPKVYHKLNLKFILWDYFPDFTYSGETMALMDWSVAPPILCPLPHFFALIAHPKASGVGH
jgi:hypothetical protein